ncbi:MAG: hypothetical protein JO072_15100 [Parafilimonas sp.]|nr:hypothetical protein [Parafilimonas sp.]
MKDFILLNGSPFDMRFPLDSSISFFKRFFLRHPTTILNTENSNEISCMLGYQYLNLIKAGNILNKQGHHIGTLCLFRTIEDSLDCFMACATVDNAVEQWLSNKLKPSQAAIKWTKKFGKDKLDKYNVKYDEYRKELRDIFNLYSHCTPALTRWIFFRIGKRWALNSKPNRIYSCEKNVEANLVFTLCEFTHCLFLSYEQYLNAHTKIANTLDKITNILKDEVDKCDKEGLYNELLLPPELKNAFN